MSYDKFETYESLINREGFNDFQDIARTLRKFVARSVESLGTHDFQVIELASSRMRMTVSDLFRRVNLEELLDAGLIRELTEHFAYLNWFRRGSPMSSIADQEADYSHATLTMRKLYAGHLLGALAEYQACPAELLCDGDNVLSNARINFLGNITLHDVVSDQARERWSREFAYRRGDMSQHDRDYLDALDEFHNGLVGLFDDRPWTCSEDCKIILSTAEGLVGPMMPASELWIDARNTSIVALLLRLCEARTLVAESEAPLTLYFDLDTVSASAAAGAIHALELAFGGQLKIVHTRPVPPAPGAVARLVARIWTRMKAA